MIPKASTSRSSPEEIQNRTADEARAYYRAGQIREAITRYREALRFETDRFERTRIYIDLARIYRMEVRTKNAYFELRRAFLDLGIPWPENTLPALLACVLYRSSGVPNAHPDFKRRSPELRTHMLADLYEEVGISAYRLLQTWTLLQVTFLAKKPCHDLGPSRALLNWYGGSACIVAMIDLALQNLLRVKRVNVLHQKSLQWMQRCHAIAAQLDPHTGPGKALIWEALLCDYHGDPLRSAELFETCLNLHGAWLDPFDVRLAAITLSINYLSRGHFQKCIAALKKQGECHASLRDPSEEASHQVPWHSLGAQAMLGGIREIERPMRLFRSILSSDNDEKWMLACYLANLLIAGRKTQMNYSQVEDLISRFELLWISPQQSNTEAGFYWIAEAYARFSFAVQNRTLMDKFEFSLNRLGKVLPHPTTQSHYAVLKAGWALMHGRIAEYVRWSQRALQEAHRIDNQWALHELDQLRKLS